MLVAKKHIHLHFFCPPHIEKVLRNKRDWKSSCWNCFCPTSFKPGSVSIFPSFTPSNASNHSTAPQSPKAGTESAGRFEQICKNLLFFCFPDIVLNWERLGFSGRVVIVIIPDVIQPQLITQLVSRPTRWSLWYWYLDVYVDHLNHLPNPSDREI